MTTWDFFWAWLWPSVIGLAIVLTMVRDLVLLRWFLTPGLLLLVLYVVLFVAYGVTSLVQLFDGYILLFVLGLVAIGLGSGIIVPNPRHRWKAYMAILIGAGFIYSSVTTLAADYLQPRLVLEGRIQKVGLENGRPPRGYVAEIASQNFKITTADYERLKLLPVVRVEIGLGSNYVYKIDYLAN